MQAQNVMSSPAVTLIGMVTEGDLAGDRMRTRHDLVRLLAGDDTAR